MRIHQAAAFAACFVLPFATGSYAATIADKECWRSEEVSAVQIQTIHAMLMIDALKCQETLASTVDGYNKFIQNKRALLVSSKHIVEGHFVRTMGAVDGTAAATNFQTRLGNRISTDDIDVKQCQRTGMYARLAAAASDEDLMRLAQLIAPAEALETCPAVAADTTPTKMIIPVWEKSAPPAAEPAFLAADETVEPEPAAEPIPFNRAPPGEAPLDDDTLEPIVAVASPPPVTPTIAREPAATPKSSKASQIKALQAAAAALNQAATSLATETAGEE